MREPSNTGELCSFPGMINQLRKYIPRLVEKDMALRDVLSKKYQWAWGCAQQKVFNLLKDDLTSPPLLTLYDPNKDVKLSADASSYGGSPPTKRGYTIETSHICITLTDRDRTELCTGGGGGTLIHMGLRALPGLTYRETFAMETGHKPLVSLLSHQALTELPPRIQHFRL